MVFNPLAMSHREQFLTKHGERVQTEDGRTIFFHDGSFCDHSPLGISCEAEDQTPLERAKNIARFWNEKLRRSELDFNAMRTNLESAAMASRRSGYSMNYGDEELEKLKQLQKIVKRHQKKLDAALSDVEELTPAHQRDHNSELGRNIQEADDFASKVRSIRV